MSNKQHLLLHWVLDIPNKQLICKVNDDLTYIAHNGGHDGFTKIYKGVTSEVTLAEWLITEKLWISEQYGEQVGYYQPDPNRVKKHPKNGWDQNCVNGLGPDGEYLDHLQRMQIIMEGYDQATIWHKIRSTDRTPFFLFSTPDKGLTIYKRAPAERVRYPEAQQDSSLWWHDHPQPCGQQPYSKSYQLSSYNELEADGCPKFIVYKCKLGKWDAPKHPELQAHYIYPKTIEENFK